MKKKILFLVNVDTFFVSHRLPIAKQLLKDGFEVHVGTQFKSYRKKLNHLGIKTHQINFNRNSLNLIENFFAVTQIFFLILKIKPQIIHLISIKPIIYGGLLSFITPVKALVVSVTGLGSMFIKQGIIYNIRKKIFNFFYKIIFLYPKLKVILQNRDDLNYFKLNCNLKKKDVVMIKGSGVNLDEFKYSAPRNGQKIITMISRIIKDKGVLEFVEAATMLKKKKFDGDFFLIGNIDKNNPSAISNSLVQKWKKEKILNVINFKSKIYKYIKNSTIIVLPSYREGFPKIVMEASACGRPVITTNVPGCRESIINNRTGLLVPVKNSLKLSNAIIKLSRDRILLKKMSKAGRIFAEKNFDINKVVSKHLQIYKDL